MEIKLVITADEKALEFARDIARSSSKLGIIGDIDQIKDQVKAAVGAEIKSEEDRPWETIEPDPIKVEVKAEPKPILIDGCSKTTPQESNVLKASENNIAKPQHTLVELRERGNTFAMTKGLPAFKEILNKYGIPKLTAPEAIPYFDQLWDDLEV